MDDVHHRIPGPPESMFYIPDFITTTEETRLLESIPPQKWISLAHRRLQALPAQLTANNTLITSPAYSSLPAWLRQPVVEQIEALGVFRDSIHGGPNHCLVNEYRPGQGILPHEDGAAYAPIVATVSLGGAVVLDVRGKKGGGGVEGVGVVEDGQEVRRWRILLEPRSLLVTCGSAYTVTLHGIAEVGEDVELGPGTVANWGLLGDCKEEIVGNGGRNVRGTRISLTFRDVRKVSKLGAKVFGKART